MPVLITGCIKDGGVDLENVMQLLKSDTNLKVVTCLHR